eukprot:scaffold128343_cov30-Tisochrysis_lutea.AAC.4
MAAFGLMLPLWGSSATAVVAAVGGTAPVKPGSKDAIKPVSTVAGIALDVTGLLVGAFLPSSGSAKGRPRPAFDDSPGIASACATAFASERGGAPTASAPRELAASELTLIEFRPFASQPTLIAFESPPRPAVCHGVGMACILWLIVVVRRIVGWLLESCQRGLRTFGLLTKKALPYEVAENLPSRWTALHLGAGRFAPMTSLGRCENRFERARLAPGRRRDSRASLSPTLGRRGGLFPALQRNVRGRHHGPRAGLPPSGVRGPRRSLRYSTRGVRLPWTTGS